MLSLHVFDQMMPRVESCMAPFVATFRRQEPSAACPYLCAWPAVGCGTQKRRIDRVPLGQDRLPLQRFMGWAE